MERHHLDAHTHAHKPPQNSSKSVLKLKENSHLTNHTVVLEGQNKIESSWTTWANALYISMLNVS